MTAKSIYIIYDRSDDIIFGAFRRNKLQLVYTIQKAKQ